MSINNGNIKLRRSLIFFLSFALLTFLSACSDDDDNNVTPQPETPPTIVALAQGNSNLSSLVAALTKYPDLVSTLNGSGQFTVFAPTNAAFNSLLSAIGQTSIDDIPEGVLRTVLEYHVIAGSAVKSNQLTNGPVQTVSGQNITVSTSGGVKLNGSANVATADVEASNGVVHVVDAVLVPPSMVPIVGTIVAPAYFNKNFSILVSAVVQAGLLETLLDADADFTLFAPTNSAFAAAGINALPPNNAAGNELLTNILTYHVLGSSVASSQLPTTTAYAPAEVETLGGKIYVTNRGGGVFINGNSQVTTANIQASNGIVHVINRTLVPPSKTIAGIAVEYSSATTPEFTQLVAALMKVPALLEAADNASANLTVFAPTDAAFQALYNDFDVADLDELVDVIGVSTLGSVLQHHIVEGRVFSSDLISGEVSTLFQDITINVDALTITDGGASSPASGLVPALLNVHATNGVIHVIDKVLIPSLD